jgi:predicted dehydrogenase
MSEATTSRIALIGCGHWGRHILRDLLLLGCEVSVITRTADSAARAVELGAHWAGTDLAYLPEVDGVVVATPTSTHAAVIRDVLDLDLPVFVEKPLTSDVGSARAIAAAAGTRVFVMDKWRYHPGIQLLREIAQSGAIGETLGLRTVRVQWGNPHSDVDCTWILLPHDLCIALEILGSVPAPVSAVAHRVGVHFTGLLGQLRVDDGRWMSVEVASNGRSNERRIEVFGDEGVALLAGGWDDHVTITRTAPGGEPDVTTLEAVGELPLLAELRAFVDYLTGGLPPRSSTDVGVSIVEAIAELRRLAGMDV